MFCFGPLQETCYSFNNPFKQAAQFQQLDQVEQSAQAEQSVPQFLQPENPPAVKCQSRLEQFLSPKVFRTVSRLKGLQSQSIIPQATAQPTSQLGLPQPTSQLGLPQIPLQMMLQGTAQGLASGVSQSMMQVFPQGVLQSVPQGSKAMYVRSQQASRKKGESKLRTSTAGPVPERLRDPRRKYCEQCPANYSRKDQLTHHENFNCLRNVKDFICDECEKEYFSDTTLMEHYVKVHLKSSCISARNVTRVLTTRVTVLRIETHVPTRMDQTNTQECLTLTLNWRKKFVDLERFR